MAQLQSLIKIQVIDEKLLIDGLKKPGGATKKDEADDYTKEKTDAADLIDTIPSATTLNMSFKKINKIENLTGFNNLVKLCLDNNQIEQINNLSFLVHLKWLDLSFNEITVLEGLETLTELEDLSLFNNKIAKVDHSLSSNINLKCLSLGNNKIDDYETIFPLRQLKNLKMFTLAGNPITSDKEYKKRISAYFENLKFLDYVLVDIQERAQAKEIYANELQVLYEQDNIINEANTKVNEITMKKKQLNQAGILFTYTLFDDLFNSDQFIKRLKHLPGIDDQIIKFKEIVEHITTEFVQTTIDKNNVRMNDTSELQSNSATILSQYEKETSQLMTVFEASKSVVSDYLDKKSTNNTTRKPITFSEWESMVSTLASQYEQLIDDLMSHELKLVEQFDKLIDTYDDKLNDYKNTILDIENTFFRSLEDNEKNFSSYIKSLCLDLIERASHEELFMADSDSDKIDEEAFSLLMDRDVCLQCIGTCNEQHIAKILKLEDVIRNNEIKSVVDEINTLKKDQHFRNRNRVLDIRNFSKTFKGQLDVFLSVEDDDDIFIE